jgi:peptidoglycan/LPS O-acetylase OafA/YrhL
LQVQSFGKVTPPPSHRLLYRAFCVALDPFKYGHFAVVFFFVLSGFVIHLRYARELHRNPCGARFDWLAYTWRRFRRLYPPLLLAIALTWVLYRVGLHFSPTLYHGQTLYHWIAQTTGADTRWTTLVGNLTFLMDFYTKPWAGDGPLWSLGYEWWFYMAYPAFWWISKKNQWTATTFMIILFALSFFPAHWPLVLACKTLGMMLTWWMGALLADVYVGRIRVRFEWIIPLMVFMAALKARTLPEQAKSAIVGLGFCGLLALCFALRARGYPLKILASLKPLGSMSYTLYVTHMPILIFIAAVIIFRSPQATMPDTPFVFLFGITCALLFAWLAHFVVEVPFVGRRKHTHRTVP